MHNLNYLVSFTYKVIAFKRLTGASIMVLMQFLSRPFNMH